MCPFFNYLVLTNDNNFITGNKKETIRHEKFHQIQISIYTQYQLNDLYREKIHSQNAIFVCALAYNFEHPLSSARTLALRTLFSFNKFSTAPQN